jgi:hypothetical protein
VSGARLLLGDILLLFVPTDAHTALLRRALSGLLFMLLLAARQEVTKKRAKGPNALWKPAMRKGRGAVALLIFSQKYANSDFALAF